MHRIVFQVADRWRQLMAFFLLLAGAWSVWCAVPVQPRWRLTGRDTTLLAGFSSDGKVLVTQTSSSGGTHLGPVHFYDVATGKKLATFLDDGTSTYGALLSPDGTILVVRENAGAPAKLRLLETATGRELACLDIPEAPGMHWSEFCLSPNGKLLAFPTSEKEKTVLKLWDVSQRQEHATLPFDWPFAFSPDGELLATGDSLNSWGVPSPPRGEIRLWHVATGRLLATFTGHQGHTQDLDFSPEGKILVASCLDHSARRGRGKYFTVQAWDVASRKKLATLEDNHSPVFLPSVGGLATSHWDPVLSEQSVKLWDVRTWQERANCRVASGPSYCSWGSPIAAKDGRVIAVVNGYYAQHSLLHWIESRIGRPVSAGSETKVLDAASGAELATIRRSGRGGGGGVHLSPDGTSLAMSFFAPFSDEGTIEMWDVPPRKPLGVLIRLWAVLPLPFGLLWWWRTRVKRRRGRCAAEPALEQGITP